MPETTLTETRLDQTVSLYDRYVMETYARYRVVFERGEGAYLWDSTGKRYLDFLAGIAVNAVGHCHPKVVAAIQEQAEKLLHVSNLYYIEQQGMLAEILCRMSGMDKVFLANSGAEANECALKIARKRGKRFSEQKTGLVAAEGSFHGRTLGTLTLTGQEKYQKPFTPLVPDATIVPWNDCDALLGAVNDRTCAILLEPIQGEGGIRPADQEYLELARELADKHQALLIFDEVQTGCGRTGDYFAFQGYGVTPDIVAVAKAMGGGFPIGACLAQGEAATEFKPGDHGTTYGGGPLACAAAYAALSAIEDDKLHLNAKCMGDGLAQELKSLAQKYGQAGVRGRGLMLALVMNDPIARSVVNKAFEKGLLINAIGDNVLRFVPPITINNTHIEECIQILDSALAEAKQ